MLHDQFKDEAAFREQFVKPLLNRLGFFGVTEQHGAQEFGKDFVFSELHRLGGMKHYAAQVKHEESIRQGPSVDALLSQIRQAFAKPFTRADSPRECYVSGVYVFNSGEITPNAKEFLLSALTHEHYGDNVHFMDGDRLNSLNEWGTLSIEATVRPRLLGLRVALRYLTADLKNRIEGKESLLPVFVNGIELYLSEPASSDTKRLRLLVQLWVLLRGIEGLRSLAVPTSVNAKKHLPQIATLGKQALPLAEDACKMVESILEKMSPIKIV